MTTKPNMEACMPGSSQTAPATNNQNAQAGQAGQAGGANDYSKAYAELEQRLGTQGAELGEYRQFFQNISPLLDKLDQAPEVVQAIIDGKVDKQLAQAVIDGREDIKDAAAVQQAHEDVKADLGKKKYDATSPEEITKLVEAQVGKFRKEFEEKVDLQTFQDYTQKFIENTTDFQEYADEVDKWLNTHDVTDIEVAYYAVKGKMSEAAATKAAELAATERAKEVLANASGVGQTATYAPDGTLLVDRLIAGRPNPNSFFGGV